MKKRFVVIMSLGLVLSAVWPVSRFLISGETVPDTIDAGPAADIPSPSSGRGAKWRILADQTTTREMRLQLARSIDSGCGPVDAEELFRLMVETSSPEDRENFRLVINEVMEQMRKHGVGSADYSTRLAEIARNPGADEVIRDYAIQHLCQWIAPALPDVSPAETDGKKRLEAVGAVVSCIQDPALESTSIPGTAIMSLCDALPRLEPALADQVVHDLEPCFLSVLRNPGAFANTQAAVIQAAARSGKTEWLPEIRVLLTADGVSPQARLSAIHALGELKSTGDLEFLRSAAEVGSPFSPALRAAVSKIETASPQ